MSKKFKVTIERLTKDTYEMIIEDDTIMGAFDQARHLTKIRTHNEQDRYFVTKIEEKKED